MGLNPNIPWLFIIMRLRVEPFTIGDFIHVFNRGNQKMIISRDISDKWRFLKMLCYFNNEYSPFNLFRQLDFLLKSGKTSHQFEWPKIWPPHKPLVKILSYCLRDNHFHLLLKEIIKGGISKFMKKIGDGFTIFSNKKYGEAGRIFQSGYRGKTIPNLKILQYIDVYIQLFNPFENYPNGIEKALKQFDKIFEFVLDDPFCSL